MNLEKGKYTITKLTPEITWIYDGINDSIYVDEAEEEAFVIDTGMADESLLELIREKVTKKPLTLVITHGHLDHSMKAGEFGEFYMSSLDDHLVPEKAEIDFSKRHDIKNHDMISIKGMELQCVQVEGHTPGSMFFINHQHKAIYPGDAVGSGQVVGVWMQLPGCPDLSVYRETVMRVKKELADLRIDDSYTFYAGHYDQQFLRGDEVEPDPPCLALLDDMIVLCEKLLSGEIKGTESDAPSFGRGQSLRAEYGKAGIVFLEHQLR